jgi:hypothetical protein
MLPLFIFFFVFYNLCYILLSFWLAYGSTESTFTCVYIRVCTYACKHYIWGRSMTQAICRQPLTTEARVYARSVHIGFLMDKVALGKYFLRVFRFFPVNIITPWLSILICHLGDEQWAHWRSKFRDTVSLHRHEHQQTLYILWDFRFSRRRVWLSTNHFTRQYIPEDNSVLYILITISYLILRNCK